MFRGTPGAIHFLQLVLYREISGKCGIDRETDSNCIVLKRDVDALVNIYKTCIQLFSGMNKLQIRSGKLYGLPLTEVGVMENEACIQTNK